MTLYGLVEENSEEVIAAATVQHAQPTYINHLAVDPTMRRCGFARRLLSHIAIETEAVDGGLITASPLDDSAEDFFKHMGFIRAPSGVVMQATTRDIIRGSSAGR